MRPVHSHHGDQLVTELQRRRGSRCQADGLPGAGGSDRSHGSDEDVCQVTRRVHDGRVKRSLAALGAVAVLALGFDAAGSEGTPAQRVPRLQHVVLIVFENREADQVAGSPNAPHFNEYARAYADLTNYAAVAHPSLPNYLALVSGSTHGITSDCTDCTASGPSLGSILSAAGRSWGGYAEGYPSSPLFAKKHMPFLYFPGQASHVHPLSELD